MRFGVAIPQVFPDRPVDLAVVRDSILRSEEAGLESLWVLESGVRLQRISAELEPLSLIAFAAGITSRVRLGTSVILSGLRNPIWLAKQIASIDHLSEGRLTIGVGLGDRTRAAIAGVADDEWVPRFEEGIAVMRNLWTEGTAAFAGSFWQYEDVAMEPKPVQHPHPPIWFGAHKPPALRRAARLGDGWMGAGASSVDDFRVQLPQLLSFLEAEGRDPAHFPISKRVYISVDGGAGAESRVREFFGTFYGNPDLGSRCALWGAPEECVEGLAALEEAGAGMVMLHPMFDHRDQLERLVSQVIPKFDRGSDQQ